MGIFADMDEVKKKVGNIKEVMNEECGSREFILICFQVIIKILESKKGNPCKKLNETSNSNDTC